MQSEGQQTFLGFLLLNSHLTYFWRIMSKVGLTKYLEHLWSKTICTELTKVICKNIKLRTNRAAGRKVYILNTIPKSSNSLLPKTSLPYKKYLGY